MESLVLDREDADDWIGVASIPLFAVPTAMRFGYIPSA